MTTYRELLARKAELDKQIADKREEELRQVIADINRQMTEYGLTPDDLRMKPSRSASRPVRPPKYRDPKSGVTWSGPGRPPAWFDKRTRDVFAMN